MEQNLNEETLLLKARAGDDLALEELINIYKPVVNRITRGYFLTNGDDEDLVQEGMIGLYKAIQTFSLSSEAKFQTFAYLCIKRQVLQAVRSSLSSKNAPLNNYLSIDSHGAISFVNADEEDEETEFYIPSEEPSPEDNVIKKETLSELDKKIRSALSKYEYAVLVYYLKGFSYKQIGIMLDKNAKSVDNAIERIRSKLEFLR